MDPSRLQQLIGDLPAQCNVYREKAKNLGRLGFELSSLLKAISLRDENAVIDQALATEMADIANTLRNTVDQSKALERKLLEKLTPLERQLKLAEKGIALPE